MTHRLTTAIAGVALLAGFAIAGTMEDSNARQDAGRDKLSQTTERPNTDTCTTDADCQAAWAALDGITEDDPQWNCLTMGNGLCGPEWTPLPDDKYRAIFDGSDPRTDVPWFHCLWAPDGTTKVVCSDGTVVTS